jgi:hypothetical protein
MEGGFAQVRRIYTEFSIPYKQIVLPMAKQMHASYHCVANQKKIPRNSSQNSGHLCPIN